ncbi:hypothetical protein BZA05DRAFT_332927 [Tricharina praecox]|uniref:uncharacterized protein n=1 Tax=Tricharina praecox TaxID=43433 RepID=UPI0022202B8B|nr:uncharacterized protein BZA05DRAFT_332927 [Tricharina praecox]KAI5855799.1 hypothetical protein BZA05DRAFT_332927 [Tricharina praecox]
MTLIADSLRLRSETLCMAFIYTNKYHHFHASSALPSPADPLDPHTLALASLSLATKSTESPRRLREFLLPAYALLQPTAAPLTFPSTLYDALRATLVTAELILLRVLRFDIRLPQPLDYVPRFLSKALALPGTEHLEGLAEDEREEVSVVEASETALGREVRAVVLMAVRDYRLVNLFTARTVAAACFFVAAERMGVVLVGVDETGREEWVKRLTSGRVEFEDFEDAVEEVGKVLGQPREE